MCGARWETGSQVRHDPDASDLVCVACGQDEEPGEVSASSTSSQARRRPARSDARKTMPRRGGRQGIGVPWQARRNAA